MTVDTNMVQLILGVLGLVANVVIAYMAYHIKHATNGMKKELEAVKYAAGFKAGEESNAPTNPG